MVLRRILRFFIDFLQFGVDKVERMQIVSERGTRFLERKLCKELYTAAAGEEVDMI